MPNQALFTRSQKAQGDFMLDPAEEPTMMSRTRELFLTHELRTGLFASTLTADPSQPSPTSLGAQPLSRATLAYWKNGRIIAAEEAAYGDAVAHLHQVVETLSPPENRLSVRGLEKALTAPWPFGPPLYVQQGTTLVELLRLREWEEAKKLAVAMYDERISS